MAKYQIEVRNLNTNEIKLVNDDNIMVGMPFKSINDGQSGKVISIGNKITLLTDSEREFKLTRLQFLCDNKLSQFWFNA